MRELLEEFIDNLKKQDVAKVIVTSREELKREIVKFLWKKNISEVVTSPEELYNQLHLYPYLQSIGREFPRKSENVVGIFQVESGVANTGTLLTIHSNRYEKLASLLPEVTIGLIEEEKIVPDIDKLFDLITPDRDMTLITGPSKTADIEKIIVKGAHGPRELNVFIIKKEGGRSPL